MNTGLQTGGELVFNQTDFTLASDWFQTGFTLVSHWFHTGFTLVLPGWSAAGWPAGAPGYVGSVPVQC